MNNITNTTNLQRLKIELSNKKYFDDTIYSMYLQENNLQPNETYTNTNKRSLLYTVVDILEAVANDVSLMQKVETEFTTTSEAYKYLQKRINDIRTRISNIQDIQEEYSPFSLMFTRGGNN